MLTICKFVIMDVYVVIVFHGSFNCGIFIVFLIHQCLEHKLE